MHYQLGMSTCREVCRLRNMVKYKGAPASLVTKDYDGLCISAWLPNAGLNSDVSKIAKPRDPTSFSCCRMACTSTDAELIRSGPTFLMALGEAKGSWGSAPEWACRLFKYILATRSTQSYQVVLDYSIQLRGFSTAVLRLLDQELLSVLRSWTFWSTCLYVSPNRLLTAADHRAWGKTVSSRKALSCCAHCEAKTCTLSSIVVLAEKQRNKKYTMDVDIVSDTGPKGKSGLI